MPLYHLKTDILEEKFDEFVRNLRSLWFEFLKEEGCLSYYVYQGFENETVFCLIGEYDTPRAMSDHFKTKNFDVLLGATQVLGRSFKLTIADEAREGGYELVQPTPMS